MVSDFHELRGVFKKPRPASTPVQNTRQDKYTLEKGDTIWGVVKKQNPELSDKEINSKVNDIMKQNNIKDATKLEIGDTLDLSTKKATDKSDKDVKNPNSSESKEELRLKIKQLMAEVNSLELELMRTITYIAYVKTPEQGDKSDSEYLQVLTEYKTKIKNEIKEYKEQQSNKVPNEVPQTPQEPAKEPGLVSKVWNWITGKGK